MIYFILRDHAAVEDIIQESFLRAVRKAPLLTEIDKYESWVKKLTRNVTLNHLRKHKRNRDELEVELMLCIKEAAPTSEYLVSTGSRSRTEANARGYYHLYQST